MPENNKPTLVNIQTDQPLPSSPEVIEIMNLAHKWAMQELERFVATETNPVICFLRGVNNTIASIIFNKEVDPAGLSNLIRQKAEYIKQLQEQKAANDANYEEKKAA